MDPTLHFCLLLHTGLGNQFRIPLEDDSSSSLASSKASIRSFSNVPQEYRVSSWPSASYPASAMNPAVAVAWDLFFPFESKNSAAAALIK
jgi:hypothetical protein